MDLFRSNVENMWICIRMGNVNKMRKYIKKFKYGDDKNLSHPILHEAIEQSGSNKIDTDEIFKFLITHEKFKDSLDDIEYLDKYGNTPRERLVKRLKETYCADLKQWIENNIFSHII